MFCVTVQTVATQYIMMHLRACPVSGVEYIALCDTLNFKISDAKSLSKILSQMQLRVLDCHNPECFTWLADARFRCCKQSDLEVLEPAEVWQIETPTYNVPFSEILNS